MAGDGLSGTGCIWSGLVGLSEFVNESLASTFGFGVRAELEYWLVGYNRTPDTADHEHSGSPGMK